MKSCLVGSDIMSFQKAMRRKMIIIFFFVGLLSGTLLAFVWCTFLLRCEVTVSSIRLKNNQSQCRVLRALGWVVCIFIMSNPEHSKAQALQVFLRTEWRSPLVNSSQCFSCSSGNMVCPYTYCDVPHSDLLLYCTVVTFYSC